MYDCLRLGCILLKFTLNLAPITRFSQIGSGWLVLGIRQSVWATYFNVSEARETASTSYQPERSM